eukprot:TRINITY_DN2140_c0_g1_i2.p1 TRINITY_DN2140_c0_g1~~TRINITY_DN2140_c0_g1_i2.p1  ORF type:complete len:153 (+),score=6.22 TRINITY_DN2140_c0_g1_i2:238-696(+)
MGQHHSFSYEELEKLQEGTTFTPHQILKLHKRFKKIDADGNGEISREEFNSIPGLAANPLLERVLAIFDTDNSQTVDFREFVKALAIFSGDCAKLVRLNAGRLVHSLRARLSCIYVACVLDRLAFLWDSTVSVAPHRMEARALPHPFCWYVR